VCIHPDECVCTHPNEQVCLHTRMKVQLWPYWIYIHAPKWIYNCVPTEYTYTHSNEYRIVFLLNLHTYTWMKVQLWPYWIYIHTSKWIYKCVAMEYACTHPTMYTHLSNIHIEGEGERKGSVFKIQVETRSTFSKVKCIVLLYRKLRHALTLEPFYLHLTRI